ncbi:MAG: flagellar basal body-associated FliL family protein [Rhizobacter sp.]|nr:flagellar basal body-associated FliL family protein [Rhizobacter sp.]
MATAAAAVVDAAVAGDAVPKKGKKKLIIILVAVLLIALLGGGAAVFMMKKKAAAAAAAEEDGGESEVTAATEKRKERAKNPPTFVPLEPFVVNLADKEADRFAQIGVTLEVEDAKFAEEMKAYMPAIRNGILMVLAHKTSAQLLSREGKLALAREIMREAVLPLGIDASAEPAPKVVAASDEEQDEVDPDAEPAPKKRKKAAAAVNNPVKHVHFSNFIVQ